MSHVWHRHFSHAVRKERDGEHVPRRHTHARASNDVGPGQYREHRETCGYDQAVAPQDALSQRRILGRHLKPFDA